VAQVSSWGNMRQVVRESIGLIGFWMTLRYLLIYLLSYKPFNDGSFDRRHGTDTGGMVPTIDLDIEDDSTKWQSNLYLGSPARVTRHLIRSLAIKPSDYTFVDYGSGKGRVLFAAADFPDLVLHMYHPFGPDILKEMLQVIEQAKRAEPGRRILVPYLFSIGVSKAVFQEFPAFELIRDELCVNNLYRWTLYECTAQGAI